MAFPAIQIELRGEFVFPLHWLVELERDFIPLPGHVACLQKVRGIDGGGEHFSVEIALHLRLHEIGDLCPADEREVTRPWRHDPERGHDAHIGIQLRQRALLFAQHVAGAMASAHTARVRPDLENVILLHVGKILFPCRGHLHKKRLPGFPSVASSGAIRSLVVLSLMPEDRADTVCELCLPHPPEHSSVDSGEVRGVFRAALMLIDPRAACGGVDDEDGHLLAGHELLRQLHAPPP